MIGMLEARRYSGIDNRGDGKADASSLHGRDRYEVDPRNWAASSSQALDHRVVSLTHPYVKYYTSEYRKSMASPATTTSELPVFWDRLVPLVRMLKMMARPTFQS